MKLLDLRDRHARIINLFKEWGITDLNNTEAAAEALRTLERRGKFVVAYQQFLKTFGNLEHRPEARPYAKDAKTLGFIAARARNKFKDANLNIAGVGDKVRAIIDEYVISKTIESGIAPIDLLDGKFKKQVKRQKSDRAAAEMMAHATKHYLQQKKKQKPDAYTKLSKHLEAILNKFSQDAKELRKALEEFIKNMERHEEENDTGLNGQTQLPFYVLLVEQFQTAGGGELTEEIKKSLIDMAVEAVEQISQQIAIVNFWNDAHKQSLLRQQLIELLDYSNIFEFETIEATADRILALARHLHYRLVAD
ncbi:MAG: type I restriction enzyme endonuclease domain-containing protein [Methylobacter sp.]